MTNRVLRASLLASAILVAGCGTSSKSGRSGVADAKRTTKINVELQPLPETVLKEGGTTSLPPLEGEGWQAMFNGETLKGWHETEFAGRGEVECKPGVVVLKMGDPFTGINWTNEFPKVNYEIALDAMRVSGSDFFCGLTVPVGDAFCSLIVGGWGGSVVGISSLDGMDASENETSKFMNLENGRWYRIRLRVTGKKIQAWVDKEKLVDVDTVG